MINWEQSFVFHPTPKSKMLIMTVDDVWISSVERAQLPPIPLLEGTTSSCMVTGVVPATTPPTRKLGIRECNVLK